MLRIGMLGIGAISKYYATALQESRSFLLTSVADKRQERLATFSQNGVENYEDYLDLIERADIDAVIVTLPNDLHFSACRAALEAGKHVCCEKPLTLTRHEAAQLNEMARAFERCLFTAFHRRYNSSISDLQIALQRCSSPIKSIELFYKENIADHTNGEAWYLEPHRCGGGCVADNGPNALDTLQVFLNGLVVSDVSITYDKRSVDQRAEIHLTTSSAARATIHLDWGYRAGEDKRVVINLVDGTVLVADMLYDYPAFKSSLYHEYSGVLSDFHKRIITNQTADMQGETIVNLVENIYSNHDSFQRCVEGN